MNSTSREIRRLNIKSFVKPAGADPGEVKWVNFHPLFLSPLLSFFSYLSNIEIIFDLSDIITKLHPPFQNPGSAALEPTLSLALLPLLLFAIWTASVCLHFRPSVCSVA